MVVAISGGSDSKALLLLFHDFLRSHACSDKLMAVTVDHRLRAESAAEAQEVASFCAGLRIRHRILSWQGEKPTTGLAAAARSARYRLLVQAADEARADLIFTGHTADDQAETIAMRAERGVGIGLAGMAPASLLHGRIWLLRPLLGTSRSELRDYLAGRGESWIDDPSNANPANERVRVRSALDQASRKCWIAEGQRAGQRRRYLAERAADLINTSVNVEGDHLLLWPAFMSHADQEASVHALRFLLLLVGGRSHLPDEERSAALLPALLPRGASTSLAGCVLVHRRDGTELRREQRGRERMPPINITLLRGELAARTIIPAFDLPVFRALAELVGSSALPAMPLADTDTPIP